MGFFPLPRDATARVRALFEARGSQGDVAKVKPPAEADDQDEGEESAEELGELEVTTTPMKAPAIKLTPEQYAIFEEKGGTRWLLDLLKA